MLASKPDGLRFSTRARMISMAMAIPTATVTMVSQLYPRMLCILLLSPLPPGGPGEGPDCPKEFGALGPFPARIRGETYLLLSCWP